MIKITYFSFCMYFLNSAQTLYMYFNYHAKIKKLILSGELIRFEIVENYHNIKPAMVLYFKNNPPMPIREHRFLEYFELFEKLGIKPDGNLE